MLQNMLGPASLLNNRMVGVSRRLGGNNEDWIFRLLANHPVDTKAEFLDEGYSEEDADFLTKIPDIINGIRNGKLNIRPATKKDRNVVKFVVTE